VSTRVAVLGGGKMGAALVGGLIDSGWEADDVAIAEIDGLLKGKEAEILEV